MDYNEILKYWFPNDEFNTFWFSAKRETDDYIKENFHDYFLDTMNEEPIVFKNSDELLAKIIVLDQFTRHIHRGSGRVYQNDSKALKLAEKYFELNYHKEHTINKVIFALMPFRHSENINNQRFVLDNLKTLEPDSKQSSEQDSEIYRRFHRASIVSFNTINKYGRFPDRKYS